MAKSKVNVAVVVFDKVPFMRENWHNGQREPCVAVWMKSPKTGKVYVHFGKAWSEFVTTTRVGGEYLVGGNVARVLDEQDHDNPPEGYDRLPYRVVLTYPRVGGYESLRKEEIRVAKTAARIKRLR